MSLIYSNILDSSVFNFDLEISVNKTQDHLLNLIHNYLFVFT